MPLPVLLVLLLPGAPAPGAPEPAPRPLAARPAAHANSLSVSRLTVGGTAARLELEVQTLSVLEVLPELDADASGVLDARELERGHAALERYLVAHYVVRSGGKRLTGRLLGVRETDPDAALAFVTQRLVTELELRADAPLADVEVEVSLFETTSPGHVDYATLEWPGQPEVPFTFSSETPVLRFTPDPDRPRAVRAEQLEAGLRRGLALDVVGLVLALVAACRAARPALGTAGLAAASAGAGFAFVAALGLEAPPRLLALAAALAVPYVAAENAMQSAPRTPWVEAALFGLVLGAELATDLGARIAGEPLVGAATLGFAAGVAATLAAAALGGTLVLRILPGRRPAEGSLAPTWARRGGSAALATVGLVLFVARAWFDRGA